MLERCIYGVYKFFVEKDCFFCSLSPRNLTVQDVFAPDMLARGPARSGSNSHLQNYIIQQQLHHNQSQKQHHRRQPQVWDVNYALYSTVHFSVKGETLNEQLLLQSIMPGFNQLFYFIIILRNS